jgi:hypothetical protein
MTAGKTRNICFMKEKMPQTRDEAFLDPDDGQKFQV